MKRRSRSWLAAGLCLLAVLALGACESAKPKVKTPALLTYLQGQKLADDALYGEAVWNISTPSAEFYDPMRDAIIKEEVNFDGVGFHAGLRFRF